MSDTNTILDAARAYAARGFAPVPIPAGSKAPVMRDWQRLRITADTAERYFNGTGNIGIILGEASGWLVDVDLDCPEAVEMAPQFLPPTDAITGHDGRPRSHWWYIAPGAATCKHADIDRSMIVELRATNLQTVVGPSVHPEGHRYHALEGEPAQVDAISLARCVEALADAVRAARGRPPTAGAGVPLFVAPPPPPPPPSPSSPHRPDVRERAIRYLDRMPGAVSGQGGHAATYAAATALVHGFGIEPTEALTILLERYNPRCEPPWSAKELLHKVTDAAKRQHREPFGWLRDAQRQIEVAPEVDLSEFRLSPRAELAPPAEPDSAPEQPPAADDPGPFPEHLLRVPGFIESVMEYNLSTAFRPQPVLALAGAICLQAVLAARKVRDESGNRTNVYCVGIAPSGAGKEHARQVNKAILYHARLDRLEGNEDIASDAGLVSAIEAQPAVLFQLDEFGRFLKTMGDAKRSPHLYALISTLMRLYSAARSTFRGKAYADAERNKTIDQPCVCVYGTTVPENFYESLTAESLTDGFAARLLLFEALDVPPRRPTTERDVPQPIIDAAAWWGSYQPTGIIGNERPVPAVVPTSPEAVELFDQLGKRVDAIVTPRHAEGQSAWARVEEKARRLALIYACSANAQKPVIDADAAAWGIALSEYLARRMLYLTARWVSEGQFDALQKRVLRFIEVAGGRMTKHEVARKTQFLTSRERQDVLANLVETGRLRVEVDDGKTKPTTVYTIG